MRKPSFVLFLVLGAAACEGSSEPDQQPRNVAAAVTTASAIEKNYFVVLEGPSAMVQWSPASGAVQNGRLPRNVYGLVFCTIVK